MDQPEAAGSTLPLDLSERLRQRFAESAAGRHHLDLFAAHGEEMANMTLDNAYFFAERTDNLQQFAYGSFDDWFNALQGEPPVFADGFEPGGAP